MEFNLWSSGRQFEAHDYGYNEDSSDEENDTFLSARIAHILIDFLQVLVGIGDVGHSLLDVEIDSVNERALLDDKLIQLFVDCRQLVDGFYQLVYLLVSLSHFSWFFFHQLELVLHLQHLVLVQLNGPVCRIILVGLQPIEILFFLAPQILASCPNILSQGYFHIPIDCISTVLYIFLQFSCGCVFSWWRSKVFHFSEYAEIDIDWYTSTAFPEFLQMFWS